MNKRILCIILSCILVFASFIPLYATDRELYASDGRTINVSSDEVELYKAVGWFETPEDAEIITMYAPDGRTIGIPRFYRDAYKAVGWYDTAEEISITMYSTDGRTLSVFRDLGEAYRQVGWYYNLSDVTVTMYDKDGNEHTVFKDNIAKSEAEGLTLDRTSVQQLIFAADGRTMYIPKSQVDAYMQVGWYRGGGTLDASRPMLALTFDDGPGRYTDRVLSCLEKYGVRATFYVQGKNVSAYKETMQRAVSLGCEIGNHTWSHINLTGASSGTISSQITQTNNAVYNATGVYPTTYRPPYGSYNSSVLASIGMPAILWSVDTLDWKTRSADKTYLSSVENASDGAIILMHDIHSPTADAVERIVPRLLMDGYQLVTVSELLNARCGGKINGKAYRSAR